MASCQARGRVRPTYDLYTLFISNPCVLRDTHTHPIYPSLTRPCSHPLSAQDEMGQEPQRQFMQRMDAAWR